MRTTVIILAIVSLALAGCTNDASFPVSPDPGVQTDPGLDGSWYNAPANTSLTFESRTGHFCTMVGTEITVSEDYAVLNVIESRITIELTDGAAMQLSIEGSVLAGNNVNYFKE